MIIPATPPHVFADDIVQVCGWMAADVAGSIETLSSEIPLPERLRAAVPTRQREFLAGRWCARGALASLAINESSVDIAPDGSPVWPAGSVGSITHATTFAWAAAALSRDLAGIGIDAEPVMSIERARRVQHRIAHRGEIARVCDALSLDVAAATTLVHSAKEALFKCVYAQSYRMFDYLDAFIETGAPLPAGSFRARLHPSVAQNIPQPVRFVGRFEAGTMSIHTGIEARYSESDHSRAQRSRRRL